MDPTWARGADVSHWHPLIDAAAAARAVSFLGIKVSEGEHNVDPTFASNLSLARAAGFELVVLYHLARQGDGAAQAARLVGLIGDLRPNERLVLDTERTSGVGINFIAEFMAELPADRRPLLYTSAGVWAAMGNPGYIDADLVDLWLPRYGSQAEPQVPDPWYMIGRTWTIWQDGSDGVVPGIDGACDTNLFHGSIDDLRAYATIGNGTP